MKTYLDYTFNDTSENVNTFDEVPLWSASFGLMLLKYLELSPDQTIIDIGSGTGFPLLELAGRLGKSCKLYGIDPWENASTRARQKIINYELDNVEIIVASAEKLPFQDNSINLIVSNLGINNFENPLAVVNECYRVLNYNGKLVLTTNLNGHWQVFYNIFEQSLKQLNKDEILKKLKLQEEHRGTKDSVAQLLNQSGLKVSRYFEEQFEMKFLDGTAFLNHYFVKLGWLSSWKEIIPEPDWFEIFTLLENNLNIYSRENIGLNLTVPMLFIEAEKIRY